MFVGTLSHEGGDRASLGLDDGCDTCKGNTHNQNAMVDAVAATNEHNRCAFCPRRCSHTDDATLPNVTAIVMGFLAGQQVGNAIADVLFGDVNPSGRLPLTMPNKEMKWRCLQSSGQACLIPPSRTSPFIPSSSSWVIGGTRLSKYSSFTGFPFGHGLSYTSFGYSNINVDEKERTVSFDLQNMGGVYRGRGRAALHRLS